MGQPSHHMNTMKAKSAPKKGGLNAAESVVSTIIKKIEEEGTLPWDREWAQCYAGAGAPRNFLTGDAYNGINRITLGMFSYDLPLWCTEKQAAQKGGTLKDGEKWKFAKILRPNIIYLDADGKRVASEKEAVKKIFGKPSWFKVYNVAQYDGLTLPEAPEAPKGPKIEPIHAAEAVLADYEDAPPVRFPQGNDRCYYSPVDDQITMVERDRFNSSEAYYCTMFHEHAHGTAHESRLARKTLSDWSAFGTTPYAYEELVAELAASMLSAVTGCWPETTQDRSAAYLEGWLKKLKSDMGQLVKASKEAQKAAEYILGCPLDDYPVR